MTALALCCPLAIGFLVGVVAATKWWMWVEQF